MTKKPQTFNAAAGKVVKNIGRSDFDHRKRAPMCPTKIQWFLTGSHLGSSRRAPTRLNPARRRSRRRRFPPWRLHKGRHKYAATMPQCMLNGAAKRAIRPETDCLWLTAFLPDPECLRASLTSSRPLRLRAPEASTRLASSIQRPLGGQIAAVS